MFVRIFKILRHNVADLSGWDSIVGVEGEGRRIFGFLL